MRDAHSPGEIHRFPPWPLRPGAGIADDLVPDRGPTAVDGSNRVAEAEPAGAPRELGRLPVLCLTTAVGLAICSAGDALSRSTVSSSQVPFWIGLLVVFVPIAFRLTSRDATRAERVCLLVLLGLALYLVKVMNAPFAFIYPDEFIHVHNANEIIRTHHLFNGNSILPITPQFPGLESVTAALSTMTGIGSFGAGLIVVGAARVVLMLALFLMFERLSGSHRVAALAAATYTANSNFLFFSAQFSYESLALPLLLLVLASVAASDTTERDRRRAWSFPIMLVIASVAVTHHLTSYALVIALIGVGVLSSIFRTRGGRWGPWPYALFATAAVGGWLVVVASKTVGYLSPVIVRAFTNTLHTLSGEAPARKLFSGSNAGYRVALLERVVGIGSIALLALAYPFGARGFWRSRRRDPLALALVLGGTAYFGVVVLRFAPAAWETANRSSEFLFVGLGFVVAFVGLERFEPPWARTLGRRLTTAGMAAIFAGGVVSGWVPEARVPAAYRVAAGSGSIEPEGRSLARWAEQYLGPNRGFAASESDARFLLVYARAFAIAGRNPDVRDVIQTTTLPDWQPQLLRENGLRYVVVDLRVRSFDNTLGYYFGLAKRTHHADELLPNAVAEKFDRVHAERIYDSGTIIVYDMGPSYEAPAPR